MQTSIAGGAQAAFTGFSMPAAAARIQAPHQRAQHHQLRQPQPQRRRAAAQAAGGSPRRRRCRQPPGAVATAAAPPETVAPPAVSPDTEPALYKSSDKPAAEFGYSRSFSAKFELGEKIGKGAHATVHEATDRATGELVAVKVMPKQTGPNGFLDSHFVRRVRNEVDIASHLAGSLNVCYFHGAYESEAAVYLVMELLSGGPLWDRIFKGTYSEQAAARIVREALHAVAQCHAKGIILRDIKPQNFMFAGPEDGSALKAVDFGISVFCRPGQYITQRAGTRIVMSPEVVRQRYSLPADLWSVGIMAYLLLTGRLPFPFWDRMYVQRQVVTSDEMYKEIVYSPLDFEAAPWDTLSDDARDFVQQLLTRVEAQRPTAAQALQHRWLQGLEAAGQEGQEVPLSSGIVQRLQRFGTSGRLKRAALRTVATCIPIDSTVIADLRGLFMELDPADSGRVPYTRLQAELEDGRYTLSPAETQQLLAQLDLTAAGDITFSEWVASLMDWTKLHESSDWDGLVERAFLALNTDGSGLLTMADLELILCGEEGCQVPDELHAALREADLGHCVDEGIGLEQFRSLLAGQLQDRLDLFETRLGKPGNGSSL